MASMLVAHLFGPLTVAVAGRPIPEITGLRPRAVLAWLLLHPGQHSRARVAATFWPDVLDTSARASLRNALWVIRAALDAVDGSEYLETRRDSVGIADRLPREIDTEHFDELATATDAAALARCMTLADQPLLTDLADDWVLEARDEYRERIADVAMRLAEDAMARGDAGEAATWARRALTRAPYRESAYRLLMRSLALGGETGEAMAAFQRCRAVLAAEFGTVPSDETRALAAGIRTTARTKRSGEHQEQTSQDPVSQPGHRARGPVALAASEPALAGREQELTQLSGAWDETRTRRGGVLLISGAAGLGKTRLVRELSARARSDGARHGVGSGFEFAGAPPFAPWTEALRDLVADTPAPPEDAAWPGELARVCRSVERIWGRTASAPAYDPDHERSLLFEAVVESLAWCAHDRPLLLVLEDVHLADRATIALLAYAGRQLARLPALLVATRRPDAPRQDLALAVDALSRGNALRAEITLQPLAAAETTRIVEAIAPGMAPAMRTRVVAAAEGNPLLAKEAARASAAGRDVSQGLREWLRAPLARLPQDARQLVDLVAAAGRSVELGEAADLNGHGPLADTIAVARREGLLDVHDRRLRFTHGLVRDACYAELEPARRAWLHGRIADALLRRRGRSAAEIARHLMLAGRPDEARGHLVTAAAKARAHGALDEAAGFLREAVALVADPELEDAEIWLALAEAEAWRGSRDGHDAAFTKAIAVLEAAGNPAALAAAYVLRARCLRTTLCFPRDALAASEHALQIIEDADLDTPELRALALSGCAWVETASGDPKRGAEFVAAAEALPESAADPGLSAELDLARGAALLRSGEFAAAERASEQANAHGRRAERSDIANVALIQAATAAAARGAVERAVELADQALRERCGAGLRAEALAVRAYGLARMGRYDEARLVAHEEVELLSRDGDAAQWATARYDAGSLALAAGRYGEAISQLSAALESDSDRLPRAMARLRLAEARLRNGELDAANAELERFPFEPAGPADLPETLVPHLERLEALVAAAQDHRPRARDLLVSAEAGWRRLLDAAPHGDVYAASLVALGRWGPDGVVEPGVELGRTLAELAVVLANMGEIDAAHRAADEASVLADKLAFPGYLNTLRQATDVIDDERGVAQC